MRRHVDTSQWSSLSFVFIPLENISQLLIHKSDKSGVKSRARVLTAPPVRWETRLRGKSKVFETMPSIVYHREKILVAKPVQW